MPYSRKLVGDLLVLLAQLLIVRQVLPLTPAAYPEMLAKSIDTYRRQFHVPRYEAFHITSPLTAYLHVHHVARHRKRDKNHNVVMPPHGLALGRQRGDLEVLYQRV